MDNLNQALEKGEQAGQGKAPWTLIAFIILVVIAIGVAWQFTGDKSVPVVIDDPVIVVTETSEKPEPLPEPIVEIPEVIVEEKVIEIIEEIKDPLPLLDNSDDWLKLKLPEITWRKELLKLIIDEDMIRRFVVFTDNFAQGLIAYEHSPFILPSTKFSAIVDSSNPNELAEKPSQNSIQVRQNIWQWNEYSSQRFSSYVDLLRSMDSESLVQWYIDIKPLIDEAYSELGYEDDFTNTFQDAITRVLDMELPKSSMELVQPSVMYKFLDPELEALEDTEKLLLRLGKDNLLVMKSFLLEIHEKLAQHENGV